MQLPATPADLTAAWLTAALRQWGSAGEVTVAHFTVSPLRESRGFFGDLVRVELAYRDAAPGAPRALVAKFASPVLEMRQRSVDAYAREVGFYQRLAPHLALPHLALPTPTCYYAAIDLSSGLHILLLEALDTLTSGVRMEGCTPAQAQAAIRAITKLHSAWWGRTDDPALDWLPDGDSMPDAALMRQQYDGWWPDFYAQAGAKLPAPLVAKSAALGQHRAAIRHHIFGAAPRTLIHRDYQADNLLFGSTEAGAADDLTLAIVDWQFFSRGRAVWDIAYLLSESMLPEVRRRVEMDLLADYHAALVTGGVTNYSFEQCLVDYRMALLQRHTALVSTIAAMPFSNEQRRIHIDGLLPRNLAAIHDHDAFALFA